MNFLQALPGTSVSEGFLICTFYFFTFCILSEQGVKVISEGQGLFSHIANSSMTHLPFRDIRLEVSLSWQNNFLG